MRNQQGRAAFRDAVVLSLDRALDAGVSNAPKPPRRRSAAVGPSGVRAVAMRCFSPQQQLGQQEALRRDEDRRRASPPARGAACARWGGDVRTATHLTRYAGASLAAIYAELRDPHATTHAREAFAHALRLLPPSESHSTFDRERQFVVIVIVRAIVRRKIDITAALQWWRMSHAEVLGEFGAA